jgi:hypothetical protein
MEVTKLVFFPRHTRITVRFRHHLYSSQLPGLSDSLLGILPSLKAHLCHNRSGLPFVEEVADTELGHVFEHVVLAVLAQRGICTRGQTTWNWHRDPLGTYNVTISTGKRAAVKEGVLVAQAIFTNALLGPVLHMELPERPNEDAQATLFVGAKGPRLLFGADGGQVRNQGTDGPLAG